MVDTQNGFHLGQAPFKDSSDEASLRVKGHLFAKLFISCESVLLDV